MRKQLNYVKNILPILLLCSFVICIICNDSLLYAKETIRLNKTKVTVNKGNTYKLELTGTTSEVTWSSNNKKVATVSSTGKVTAKTVGITKITATVGGQKYTCTVTVPKIYLNRIMVGVNKGRRCDIWLEGTNKKAVWKSSNTKVVTVQKNIGIVKGIGYGKAKITATLDGKTYTCTITVPKVDVEYVRREATRQLKEKGFYHIPELMDEALALGKISPYDYDKYYPSDGASWLNWTCWVDEEVTNEKLIQSIVGLFGGVADYDCFYIGEFQGINDYGTYVFRVYRSYKD